MRYEYSAGAVVYTVDSGVRKYVVIRSRTGSWGYPKGHIEKGETEQDAALREVKEETGLDIELDTGFVYRDEYPLPLKKKTLKKVVYFVGRYEGQTPTPQPSEVSKICLFTKEEALSHFRYDNLKNILTAADEYIERGAN